MMLYLVNGHVSLLKLKVGKSYNSRVADRHATAVSGIKLTLKSAKHI